MKHCIETIQKIVDSNQDDRRSLLQLGYNLGRLSEITALGREPFWDRWKEAVTTWDSESLKRLAQELHLYLPIE